MDLLSANDRPGAYPDSWYAATTPTQPPRPAPSGAIRADVCVVGGGYTGLSAALHLAERGVRVVLLEAQRVGWGASGRNGGQVASGQRRDQAWLEKRLGIDRARALWELAQAANRMVRARIARHGIDCDLCDGIVYAAHRAGHVAELHAEAGKLALDYGYDRVDVLDRQGVAARLGTDVYHGGILDRGAAHLNPLAYALGLARAAEAAGAVLHEGARVRAIRQDGPAPVVETDSARVTADHVILGCNGYLGDLMPAVAARVMPINNFIIATEPLGTRAPMTARLAAADTRFVVNYWRQSPDGRLLFGGGESYGYRFPADIAAKVRGPLARVYPALADVRITHAWGGTLAITMDRMPAFQRIGRSVWSAAGYSGQGVAMATMAGAVMAEAVAGDTGRFDLMAGVPARVFPGGAALRWPVLVLAMTWYALRDRL